jgi:hypothetical protein
MVGTDIALMPANKGKNMKPTSPTARNSRRFPLVKYNYQPSRLADYYGRCAKTAAPAFWSISREYFQKEARRDFVREAFFFAVIIATAVAPLLSMASALSEFCRAIAPL